MHKPSNLMHPSPTNMLRAIPMLLMLLCTAPFASAQSEPTYKDLYNKGVQYFQAANYPQAVAWLNKAIEADGSDPDAWYNRGVAKMMTGDYASAIGDFSQAIKLNPSFIDAYYNRGQAAARMNDPVSVVDDMNKVLEMDRAYTDAYAMRGQNYFYLDNYVDGCQDLKSAYELGFKKAESQIKLYCNVPAYFTEVPLTEDFIIEWNAMGQWKETSRTEHIDEVRLELTGSGKADGLKARQVFMRNMVNIPMEEARKRVQQLEAGAKAKLKVSAEGKDGNYDYSLFTLQEPETKAIQLWYLYQGERGLYANAILFPNSKPPKSDLQTWGQFLQLGELKIEQKRRKRG